MRISIVGYGYVGRGQEKLLSLRGDVEFVPFDEAQGYLYEGREELLATSDLIIVCVPTPMMDSGEVDVSIVLEAVVEVCRRAPDSVAPILIRSTVAPGTTETIGAVAMCSDRLNFSPEFIVERTGDEARDRMIVGGPQGQAILDIFEPCLEVNAKLWHIFPREAEFVKYRTNAFLSIKVAFAVEMAALAKSLDLDPGAVTHIWELDERMGKSHNRVIEDDQGRVGFGGKCLPKDTSALQFIAKMNAVPTPLLDGAMNYIIKD